MIHVTKSYLPPIERYNKYLRRIWESGWLTNNGALVQELEEELTKHLGVQNLFLVANGTLAIQLAIRALGISKKVITTPYSYVATTTSVLWERCIPVFADVSPSTYCIDPEKTETLIDEDTEAILATHVYGLPCQHEALQRIAKKHGIRLIYDAAHAFGVKSGGTSILNWGDVSTLSFHATKLFHTVEGGAVITSHPDIAEKISLMRKFGHVGNEYFCMGINAKNSEFHAAMGLSVLPDIPEIIAARKQVSAWYTKHLDLDNLHVTPVPEELDYNYSYFPVFLASEAKVLKAIEALAAINVKPRRYFYPSLNKLPYLDHYQPCPVSEDLADRALCLPLYRSLNETDVRLIAQTINNCVTK